jgi:hypothetical protein
MSVEADAELYGEGGLQWNNGYLTALSPGPKCAIYQFQVTGTKAHKVSATPLDKPANVVLQYFIDGGTIVVPNLGSPGSNVLYYKYPAGGQPTFTLTKGVTDARGVVVSSASQ